MKQIHYRRKANIVVLCEWGKDQNNCEHVEWMIDEIKKVCCGFRAANGKAGNIAFVKKASIPNFGTIHDALIKLLINADIVVADCTGFKKSGKLNFNVVYEMGMALGIQKIIKNHDLLNLLKKRKTSFHIFVLVESKSEKSYIRLLTDRSGNLRLVYKGNTLSELAKTKIKNAIRTTLNEKNAKRK